MADLFEEQLMNQMHQMITTIKSVKSVEMRDRLARALQEAATTLVPTSYDKLTEQARAAQPAQAHPVQPPVSPTHSAQPTVSQAHEPAKVMSPLVPPKAEPEKAS